MTGTATPALDELDERQRAIEAAQERVAELEVKAKDAGGELDRLLAELSDYHRAVEVGDAKEDAEHEAALTKRISQARRTLVSEPVHNRRGEIGGSSRVRLFNPQIEGQLQGARQKLGEARDDYNRFLRSRFDDLVVELAGLGADLAKESELVIAHARNTQAKWNKLRRRWQPLIDVADFSLSDFPSSPFGGGIADAEVLMPKQLATGGSLGGPRRPRKRHRAQR